MHPWKAILSRWRDILLYGAIAPIAAIPLGVLVSQAIDALLSGIAPELSNLATLLRYSCFSLLFAMVWWQSGTRVSHYRLIHRYPPALTAVPVSLAMVIGLALLLQPDGWRWLGGFSWRNPISASAYGTTALVLIATVYGFLIAKKRSDGASASVADDQGRDLQSISDADLIEWLSSEAPPEDASEDMFRARERARMVFKALQTPRANKRGREIRQTAVVQGPFGAGKTTVVRYAERYAHQSGDELYIFAHVNCWGFSSLSAQEHVLEEAIDALSKHADVLALRNVPSAYADAISESSTWFGAVFRVLGGARTPVAQLQRFTPILRAIGAQLVIVVEDTDRNGPDFDQKHIEAMLYNFREVERVSFILTAGNGSRIDFPKIAEHILFIPALPSQTILTLLDRARSHCTANLEFIDPTVTKGAPRNRPPSLCENVNFLGYHEVPGWAEACAELVATPRRLKQTLSSILTRWEILHGEVDLDELIMVTVLRVCAPSVFTFFGMHFQEFKPLYEARSQNELPERVEARKSHLEHLRSRWQQAVDESGCDSKVVAAIIGELIPSSASVTRVEAYGHGNRAQSINSTRGSVYWGRLTSEFIGDDEVRDQDVLSTMRGAQSEEGIGKLGASFAKSKQFAETVVFFDRFYRLDDSILLRAATVAIKAMRPLDLTGWHRGHGSYLSLRLWLDRLDASEPAFHDWLIATIDECAASSIPDANALHFDFHHRLDSAAQANVRQRYIKSIREKFEHGTAVQFASCFNADHPYSLSHLIRLDQKEYPEGFLTHPRDWQWIARLLLDGMKERPQTMVPQVMMALGTMGPNGDRPTWFRFDESALAELFQRHLPEALSLLSREFPAPDTMEGRSQEGFLLAAKAANELARKQVPPE